MRFIFPALFFMISGLNAQILYYNDFNENNVGLYDEQTMREDWNFGRVGWFYGFNENRVHIINDDEALEGNSMSIIYPQGKIGGRGGVTIYMDFPQSYEELYLSFWIKFKSDFDFVKGGKVPGLAGGEGNTGGSKPDGTDGWSARIMWGRDGAVRQYVYHPDQPGEYGEGMRWDLGGQRYFIPGKWHHCETRIVMNSPGDHNGIIQSWFNDSLALDRRDIRFRDVDTFGIETLQMENFFGGNSSDWQPVKDETAYFDNFIISTYRVGAGEIHAPTGLKFKE